MKYTVEHYNTRGHMETTSDLSRADLREELARYVSDVPGTGCCSKAFDDSGRCIAFRHWDKKRVSWMVKREKPATAPDYPAIITELKDAIESALLRDDIADDELGDVLRSAITKAEESLQSFTI